MGASLLTYFDAKKPKTKSVLFSQAVLSCFFKFSKKRESGVGHNLYKGYIEFIFKGTTDQHWLWVLKMRFYLKCCFLYSTHVAVSHNPSPDNLYRVHYRSVLSYNPSIRTSIRSSPNLSCVSTAQSTFLWHFFLQLIIMLP